MNLLHRTATYFKNWNGTDEDAPKMELSIDEIREISSLNTEKCRIEQNYRYIRKRFIEGISVLYEGDDESDGIHCPSCTYEVARNDDSKEYRPKNCPGCGTKLIY